MSNLRTCLHDWHVAKKARMVPFGGWDMPVQYTGIIDEHTVVRTSAGLFDISHMARLEFHGVDSQTLIDKVFTNNVAGMKPGQVRYGLICNETGGVLDDVLVYRLPRAWSMVVNASNRPKILAWLEKQKSGLNVAVIDHTDSTVMLAVQGPNAISLAGNLVTSDINALGYYFGTDCECLGKPAVVSRTGYTGEDGFEIWTTASVATELADAIIATGVKPAGLGARDTLRLEAAMPLYGHELNEETDPLSAGLAWAVKLNKGDFIGRDAIQAKSAKPPLTRIGLTLEGKRAAREGCPILTNGVVIGQVTSGSFAPHLQQSIAMGYIPNGVEESDLQVDIRGSIVPARVTKLPFYQRSKSV